MRTASRSVVARRQNVMRCIAQRFSGMISTAGIFSSESIVHCEGRPFLVAEGATDGSLLVIEEV